jgi:hypothetical protein
VRASLQARSVFGRAWALRRAYYDLALADAPVTAPQNDRLPAWHEVDVAFGRDLRVGSWRTRVSLSVLNALARANAIDAWLVPDDATVAPAQLARRAIGRQWLLGVELGR